MKKILVLSLAAVATGALAIEQNGAGFQIPDNLPAGASSSITLSNAAVSIDYIRLNTFTHTWIGDIDANVNGISIMNSVGSTTTTGVGDSSNVDGNYTFAAAGLNFWTAAAALPDAGVIAGGTYMSSNFNSGGASNGFIPGGFAAGTVFTLTMSDNAAADLGGIASWTIGYTAVPEPATMAALGLGAAALIRRRRK